MIQTNFAFAKPKSCKLGGALVLYWLAVTAAPAHASLFQGETLDAVANGIAWVVLMIAPIIGIAIFWLVHIMPEKIAHNKKHPQTRAIQCLCLLSLCFGGLLWPIAWLWAYSKPVLHKLAYGTDVDETLDHHRTELKPEEHDKPNPTRNADEEVKKLRARVVELEGKLNRKGGKV